MGGYVVWLRNSFRERTRGLFDKEQRMTAVHVELYSLVLELE